MSSTWIDLKATYYLGKILGLFPFDGKHKFISFLFSLFVWLIFGAISSVRIFFKFIVAFITLVISAQRSNGFFKLIKKFHLFDTFSLQKKCPSNFNIQILYMLYASSIEVYYFMSSVFNFFGNPIIVLIWTLMTMTTMIMIIQYISFIRILRDRYKIANEIFLRNINISLTCTKLIYPKEIVNLYNELRCLTVEVKNYYSYYAILFIIEINLMCISCVTSLILSYTNNINLTLFTNELFSIYCILKLLFLFLVVRETHNTVVEAQKTTCIAHEALSVSSNSLIIKELEILIMTYWNHPIVFDVYDFFDLDYKLLQSIIAAIVTYAVVLVQIQLAISETKPKD